MFYDILKVLKLTFIKERMLAVLITLTPGCRNIFIDCLKATFLIAVLAIMNVKTCWNSTLELLKCAYSVREFTCEWLQNRRYAEFRPLFTTQDVWMNVMYIREVFRPFQYWTVCMSTRHTVRLHHAISVNNDMFDQMDSVMRALAKIKTQLKEDLFIRVKLTRQKLSNYYADVTPTTGMPLYSAHILHHFRKSRLLRKWDQGMDNYCEDVTPNTTQ